MDRQKFKEQKTFTLSNLCTFKVGCMQGFMQDKQFFSHFLGGHTVVNSYIHRSVEMCFMTWNKPQTHMTPMYTNFHEGMVVHEGVVVYLQTQR